jgi:hypothetical protein
MTIYVICLPVQQAATSSLDSLTVLVQTDK